MIIGSNTKINVFINMINEEVLKEKLQYLITANSAKWFDIMSIYLDFEYVDESKEKLSNYDLDISFDYHGAIDIEFGEFVRDIQTMSDRLKDILMEFVINQEGKIVSGKNTNVWTTDPLIFSAEFKADETHKFILGYKFHYEQV